MATTLSKLRSMWRSEMKLDRVGRVWSDEEWNDAINEAILEIQNRGDFKWIENQQETTFPAIVDQQEYDLSTLVPNFIGLDLVKYDNVPLDSVNYVALKANTTTFPSWLPTEYYLYGGNLGLNPIPVTGYDVEIVYRAILSDLVLDTDESPFGQNFDRAIVTYASYTLLTKPWDSKNFQRSEIKMKRFNEIVGRLYKTYLIQDKAQFRFKTTYTPRSKVYASRRGRLSNI